MNILFFTIILVFLIGGFVVIPEVFAYGSGGGGSTPETDGGIPVWIKHVAGFWYDEKIPDKTFLSSIQWLVNNEIIIVTPTDSESGGGEVPDWVKSTAGWWADDTIDDDTFINAITYLIQQGLIQV